MNPAMKTRILILDDHAVFSEALGRMLESEPDFQISGKCASVEDAIVAIAKKPADVVLLDLNLEGTRGSAFCSLARDFGFKGKILVVTAGVSHEEAITLLSQGASGVFLKRTEPELLAPAIREVVAGHTWIDPNLAHHAAPGAQGMRNLTERERHVLMDVFEGLTNKAIAARLNVSEEAVKSTIQQLFSKLGVRTRVQLARKMMDYIGERGRSA